MFYKIKSVIVNNDFRLVVLFVERITNIYDIKPLFSKFAKFNELKENGLFYKCISSQYKCFTFSLINSESIVFSIFLTN